MTFPHTFENGITILRVTRGGAFQITDGMMVAFIISSWIRPDGTLTGCGMKALLDSTKTLEQYEEENHARQERVEREKKEREEAWKKRKEEGSKLVTYVLERGILMSANPSSYKYIAGRKRDIYGRPCNFYIYIPKSQVKVERKDCKVYVTLPKWLAGKHSIFKLTE